MNPLKKTIISFLVTSIFLNWTAINNNSSYFTYATSSSVQGEESLFKPFPELSDAIYPPLPEEDYRIESETQEETNDTTNNAESSSSSIEVPLPPPTPSKTNIKVLETFGEILLAYEDSILNAPQNKNIIIDAIVDSSKIGNDIFYNMAQRPDLTLTVLGDGYEWFIDAFEIKKDKEALDLMNFYIDFNVKTTSEIEPLVLPIIDKPDLVSFISFDYKGTLPGKSIVKINLGSELANKNFILYEYDKKFDVLSAVAEDLSTDSNGILTLSLSKFDDYMIAQESIIQLPRLVPYLKDDTQLADDSSIPTDAPIEEPKGPSLLETISNKLKTMNIFVLATIVAIIILFFIILIVIIMKKNKKKNANKIKKIKLPKLTKHEKAALKIEKKLAAKAKTQANKQKAQQNKTEKIQKQKENKEKKIEKIKKAKETKEKAKSDKIILSPEDKIRAKAESKIKAIEDKKNKQNKAQQDKKKKEEQSEKDKLKKIEKEIQMEIKKAQAKQKELEEQKAKFLSMKAEEFIEDEAIDLDELLEESPPQE